MSAPNLTGTHLIVQIKQSQNAYVLGRIGKPPAGRLDGMARGFCVSRRLLHHRHRAVCVQQKDAHSATDGVATFNFAGQKVERQASVHLH